MSLQWVCLGLVSIMGAFAAYPEQPVTTGLAALAFLAGIMIMKTAMYSNEADNGKEDE